MICIGIDPGLSGAVAFIGGPDGVVLADLPTTVVNGDPMVKNRIDGRALGDIVRRNCPAGHAVRVFCESVNVMGAGAGKNNAIQTQGSLLRTLGAIEAVFDMLRCPCEMVRPQEWQDLYGLAGKKNESRGPGALPAATVLATRLYADAAPMLTRVKDHNRAEALLIAHWGMRKRA